MQTGVLTGRSALICNPLCKRASLAIRCTALLLAAAPITGCERAPDSSAPPASQSTASPSPQPSSAPSGVSPGRGPSGSSEPAAPDLSKFPSAVRSEFEQMRARYNLNPKDADLAVTMGAICYVH